MRGFKRPGRTQYSLVNLDRLAGFPANSTVSPQVLVEAGVLKSDARPVKVLGRGELDFPLVVEAHRFSSSAKQKIEAAGGAAKEVK